MGHAQAWNSIGGTWKCTGLGIGPVSGSTSVSSGARTGRVEPLLHSCNVRMPQQTAATPFVWGFSRLHLPQTGYHWLSVASFAHVSLRMVFSSLAHLVAQPEARKKTLDCKTLSQNIRCLLVGHGRNTWTRTRSCLFVRPATGKFSIWAPLKLKTNWYYWGSNSLKSSTSRGMAGTKCQCPKRLQRNVGNCPFQKKAADKLARKSAQKPKSETKERDGSPRSGKRQSVLVSIRQTAISMSLFLLKRQNIQFHYCSQVLKGIGPQQ